MAENNSALPVTDVRALRAIAHPLRARLLALLRIEGPATATELGRRTGESSGATSYHLRQLARYGFVEDEGPRKGRERRWRATARYTTWQAADFAADPQAMAASEALERRQLSLAIRHFEAWLASRPEADPGWLRAAAQSDDVIRLSPSQALALNQEILAVWRRYRDAPVPADEEQAHVALYMQMLPIELAEALDV